MTKQKSKFLNFFISIIPGAGQMYLGFLKRGASIMLYFFASIALIVFSRIGILSFITVIICFYSFFDSMSLNGMPAEQFAQKHDDYLSLDAIGISLIKKEKTPVYFGWFLIAVGFISVWGVAVPRIIGALFILGSPEYEILWRIYELTPRILICLVAIIGGLVLVGKKKNSLTQTEQV